MKKNVSRLTTCNITFNIQTITCQFLMTKMKPLMELSEPFYCLNHATVK